MYGCRPQVALLSFCTIVALLPCSLGAQQVRWAARPSGGYVGLTYDGSAWTSQQSFAQALGGSLTTVTDAADAGWLWSTFRADWAPPSGSSAPSFYGPWVGLYCPASLPGDVASNWLWDSAAPLTFSDWAPNQPDFANERFGHLNALDGRWNNTLDSYDLRALVEVSAVPGRTWTWPQLRVNHGRAPIGACTGDIDGDGDVDIVEVADSDVYVWMQDAAGSFSMVQTFPHYANMGTLLDLGGDGDLDLALAHSQHIVSMPVGIYEWDGAAFVASSANLSLNSPTQLVVADLNQDGRDDLIGSADDPSDYVRTWLQDPSGALVEHQTIGSQGDRTYGVYVCDANGDAWPDVAVRCFWSREVKILAGSATGHVAHYANVSFPVRPIDLDFLDLDQDGDQDMVVGLWLAGQVQVVYNDGVGNYSAGQTLAVAGSGSVDAADFDGDGLRDWAATSRQSGEVSVAYGDNPLTIAGSFHFGGGAGTVGPADLDGDGFPELLANLDHGEMRSVQATSLPAVAASATSYGSGCGLPPLVLTPAAPPILGGVGSAVISNAPTSVGGVTVGFDDQLLAGLPLLPISLAGIGMPGCSLLHSNEMFGLPVVPAGPGALNFSYSIPTSATLLRAHVYLQAYCWAPGANPLQIIVSNGVDWRIGNQ